MKKIFMFLFLAAIFFPASAKVVEGDHYIFNIPEQFVETELQNQLFVRTFVNDGIKIRIFSQSLEKFSYDSYIEYGNQQLYAGKAGFQLLSRKEQSYQEGKALIFRYKRPLLEKITEDQNYYIEAHLFDNKGNRALTVWGKAPEEKADILADTADMILRSLEFTEEGFRYSYYFPFYGQRKTVDLKGDTLSLSIPENQLLWGRFSPGYPFYKDSGVRMEESEAKLEHKFEFIMTYKTFPAAEEFPLEKVREVYREGRVLMLTLQPFSKDLSWLAVPDFIEGKHD